MRLFFVYFRVCSRLFFHTPPRRRERSIFDFWVLISVARPWWGPARFLAWFLNEGCRRARVHIATAAVCYSRRTIIWDSTRHGSACDLCWIRSRTGKREPAPSGRLGSGRPPKTSWTECSGRRPCARAARWVVVSCRNPIYYLFFFLFSF